MKKYFVILLLIVLAGVSGCKKEEEGVLTILLPDGIPAIALGGLFNHSDLAFKIVSGPDILTSELVQENYDIIVAPITAGAKLYLSEATSYHFAAVLTTGNSYIVSQKATPLVNLKDLEGKQVAAYGEANTPDIILKAALAHEEVTSDVVYETSVNEVVSNRFIGFNTVDYILCAEPVLSKLELQMGLEINIIDLQSILSDQISLIPQAGIFIHTMRPEVVQFLDDVEENIDFLNQNTTEYVAQLLKLDATVYPTFQALGEETLIHSIPRSQIYYERSITCQTELNQYFAMINQYNAHILGGVLPDENFIQ
ncbi:MAG: ABC transporter substrate-binding protein [Bacilli bacterium]